MTGHHGRRWVIAVRLNDGRRAYVDASLDRRGQSEWTPRVNQAQRFDTEAEAAKVTAAFDTHAPAKEYEVQRIATR